MCYFDFPYEIIFQEDNANANKGIYKLIKKNPKIKPRYSEKLKNLINQMIEINENQRPDIKVIYEAAKR